jgi:hypothetical protein
MTRTLITLATAVLAAALAGCAPAGEDTVAADTPDTAHDTAADTVTLTSQAQVPAECTDALDHADAGFRVMASIMEAAGNLDVDAVDARVADLEPLGEAYAQARDTCREIAGVEALEALEESDVATEAAPEGPPPADDGNPRASVT